MAPFPLDFHNWQEVINGLNVEENLFSKEDFELYRSWLDSRVGLVEVNDTLFNVLQSQDSDFQCRKQVFKDIRKIGGQLLQNKKQDYDAYNNILKLTTDIINTNIVTLGTVATGFSVSPIVDAKQAIVALMLETQTVIMLDKFNQTVKELKIKISNNTWCYDCCEKVF